MACKHVVLRFSLKSRRVLVLVPVALLVSACGSQRPTVPATKAPPTSTSESPTSTSVPAPPTTAPETLTVSVVASPNPVSVGVAASFTVTIRGPGVLSGEDVHFGDGGTTGANAGMVPCGQTARADFTHTWTHTYAAPGTYVFSEEANAIGPPPSCRPEEASTTTTVIVSSPLQTATQNGTFLSPTSNIACNINPSRPDPVRCATFSPPQLVTMDPSGSISTCTGGQCELGNPGPGTPVLPYGSATGTGPYQCVSATNGVMCTVTGGKGFRISRSGVVGIGQ